MSTEPDHRNLPAKTPGTGLSVGALALGLQIAVRDALTPEEAAAARREHHCLMPFSDECVRLAVKKPSGWQYRLYLRALEETIASRRLPEVPALPKDANDSTPIVQWMHDRVKECHNLQDGVNVLIKSSLSMPTRMEPDNASPASVIFVATNAFEVYERFLSIRNHSRGVLERIGSDQAVQAFAALCDEVFAECRRYPSVSHTALVNALASGHKEPERFVLMDLRALRTSHPSPRPSQFVATAATRRSTALAPLSTLANSLGIKLVHIPEGEFLMGSGKDYNWGEYEETRQVRIERPFLIGQTPVTRQQWFLVMGKSWEDPWRGIDVDDESPATGVSWDDAVDFCDTLSQTPVEREAGRSYRLPTEAEWEYACRCGMTGPWFFGEDESQLEDYAWFFRNSANKLHPVASKQASPWSLYDVYGNAWEWCSDEQVTTISGTLSATVGGVSCRVIRGGGYRSWSTDCSSCGRGYTVPRSRRRDIGFRVVADVTRRP